MKEIDGWMNETTFIFQDFVGPFGEIDQVSLFVN